MQRSGRVHNRGSVNRNRASQNRRHIERRNQRNQQTKARQRTRDVNRARATDRARANDRKARANERRTRARDTQAHRRDTRAHRRAHFNNQQRTRIRNYYRGHRHRFHRVARVAWPIVIGGFVPRDYTVYDIPNDFYGYVPGYEGYKYVVVGDQLIIIDPYTWEIVAIIPL